MCTEDMDNYPLYYNITIFSNPKIYVKFNCLCAIKHFDEIQSKYNYVQIIDENNYCSYEVKCYKFDFVKHMANLQIFNGILVYRK